MMEKELCIRCGTPTPYSTSTPITIRRYYIEGSGQLYEQCYFTLYPMPGSVQSNLGDGLDQQLRSEELEEDRPDYSE